MVLVGSDPAAMAYVESKSKACGRLGIRSETIRLPADVAQSRVLDTVDDLNRRADIHGVLVQLPLPASLRLGEVLEALSPVKDVDGLHPINVGRMAGGDPLYVPCTPAGIQQLLIRSGQDPEGRHVVILGRSNIVGRPLANLLMSKGQGGNATVTICHTATRDLAAHSRSADILVVAMGRPLSVNAEMVREGAVVIDVGIHRLADKSSPRGYRLVGDVDFPSVSQVASWITPVPGGVGPMTIAMLLFNTVRAATVQAQGTAAGDGRQTGGSR
jgi:methylenetetrahydrofolate dehydrogenase (NADP+)/methenyltetrahydrofolate cyclohydrolase